MESSGTFVPFQSRDDTFTEETSPLFQNERINVTNNSDGGDIQRHPGSAPANRKLWWLAQLLGYSFVLLYVVLHATSVGLVQLLDSSLPDAEVNLFRFSCQPIFAALLILCYTPIGTDDALAQPPRAWYRHFLVERGDIVWTAVYIVVNNFQNLCAYTAASNLPLLSLAAGYQGITTFLVWISSLIITRKCRLLMSISAISAVSAITLIWQPWHSHFNHTKHHNCLYYCGGYNNTTMFNLTDDLNARHHEIRTWVLTQTHFGYVIVSFGAVLCAIQMVVTEQKLTKVSAVPLLFWAGIGGVLLSTAQMYIQPAVDGHTKRPNFDIKWCIPCVLCLVFHALSASLGNVFWLLAQQRVPVLNAQLLRQCIIYPLYVLMQYEILHMFRGHQNWIEYVGIGLAFMAVIIGPVYSIVKESRAQAAAVRAHT